MAGGTFTITNPGVFGALMGTPIIPEGQVAILDVEAIVTRPVVVSDAHGNDSIARRQGATPDTVMLLEHEPVITRGSRAVRGEELLLAAIEYTRRGIEVVEVN